MAGIVWRTASQVNRWWAMPEDADDPDEKATPCPGVPVTGIPEEWDTVEVLLGHAILCPVPCCRQWVKRWLFGQGKMRHGDPGQ
jgi:hypothetical protein